MFWVQIFEATYLSFGAKYLNFGATYLISAPNLERVVFSHGVGGGWVGPPAPPSGWRFRHRCRDFFFPHTPWTRHNSEIRTTQSIIYVPLQVIRFHKSIVLIVQYKYLKSCSEDLILKGLILRTRSCGTAFITQHSWLLHSVQAEICLVEMISTTVVPASKGHIGGASP